MKTTLPDVFFQYDSGDSTNLTDPPHACTGWRIIPGIVAVCQDDASALVEFENGDTYDIYPPDAFIIPYRRRHRISRIEWGDHPVSVWCHFQISLFQHLDLFRFYDLPCRIGNASAANLKRHILELNAAHQASSTPEQLFLRQCAGFELVKTILAEARPKANAEQMLGELNRLEPVFRYMREHLNRSISLGELAATLHLSPSRFSGLFQQITGTAPVAYFNQLRISRAQEMLLTADDKIEVIAEKLGYFDAYHFSHKFKQATGTGPREYRNSILRSLYSASASE